MTSIVESARDVRTIWGYKFARIYVHFCPLYCPYLGDIVGREYINSCKFISPYGTSLADSTIAPASEVTGELTLPF
jgi:hypothetical protein